MKKRILLYLLFLGLALLPFNVKGAMESSPSSVDTITPPSGVLILDGDLDMGANSIDGHATTGLYFDSDNDGVNEFTMEADGTFTVENGDIDIYNANPYLNFRDTDDDTAYIYHYETAASAAPYQGLTLFRGTDDGTGFTNIETVVHHDTNGDTSFPTGSVTVVNDFNAKVKVTLDTAANITLTSTNCQNAIRVNNDNDVIDYTLPNATPGLNIVIQSMYAAVVTIDCFDVNESITLDDTTLTSGNAIDSPGTKGDYILLIAISPTQWVSMGRSGAWVDGGAD